MYKSYLDSYLGIIEIGCDEKFLKYVTIVKKKEEVEENSISIEVKKQLQEYFDSKRKYFDVPIEFTDSFKDKVYKSLYETSYGSLLSYKDLATSVNSKAYQAVGTAMGNNPYFIVVPWHRVINSNGELGEFFHGTKVKEKMIFFEKEKEFTNKMYIEHVFSDEEISCLKNNSNLNKMFEVMEMETKLNKFKDYFACMISNIIYQQVAFKVARYSEVMLFDYLDYEVTPEKVLKLSDKEFKRFKIFGRRLKYIRNFALFVIENEEFCKNIYNLSEEEIYDNLILIPGVGSWTLEMFFIFGIPKKDILSLKDLIIVRGLKFLYEEEDVEEIRESILEYGTITSINLWKFIEQGYYKKLETNKR